MGAKTGRTTLRLKARRAQKAFNRARYESLAGTSANRKRKHGNGTEKRTTVKTISHRLGACGNLACKRCHPDYPPYASN